jgi:hypothetical protein
LLAGIDLLTGKVHALVRDRHRSKEFKCAVGLSKLLPRRYHAAKGEKLIRVNDKPETASSVRSC